MMNDDFGFGASDGKVTAARNGGYEVIGRWTPEEARKLMSHLMDSIKRAEQQLVETAARDWERNQAERLALKEKLRKLEDEEILIRKRLETPHIDWEEANLHKLGVGPEKKGCYHCKHGKAACICPKKTGPRKAPSSHLTG